MDLGIAGKTALITAASGGMGRNIARALAAEGARPVLFARSADKLDATASEIRADYNIDALAVAGDMLKEEDLRRLKEILVKLGGLDILVLVTGRPPWPIGETLEEGDASRWQAAYENQLLSVIKVANALVPGMLERGWGRIVSITSASAKQPMVRKTLSTTFRAGVTAYLKGLAVEIAHSGVTVNCVAPVFVETPHREGTLAYTEEESKKRAGANPLGRLGTQEELCGTVLFLASQQSGFTTGSTITVDGGMVSSLF